MAYTAISYYFDIRFGLSEVDINFFDELPTSEDIEQIVFETAADVVRIFRQNQYGKYVLESEHIYHDEVLNDAGDEGDFLYDDI